MDPRRFILANVLAGKMYRETHPELVPPIQEGIPAPERPERALVPKSQVFREMKPGQSRDFRGTKSARQAWQSLATTVGRSAGWQFASETISKGGEEVTRIWRKR